MHLVRTQTMILFYNIIITVTSMAPNTLLNLDNMKWLIPVVVLVGTACNIVLVIIKRCVKRDDNTNLDSDDRLFTVVMTIFVTVRTISTVSFSTTVMNLILLCIALVAFAVEHKSC